MIFQTVLNFAMNSFFYLLWAFIGAESLCSYPYIPQVGQVYESTSPASTNSSLLY